MALTKTTFGVWDYVVLAIMLAASMSIGIYYAVFRKSRTTTEYLVAGRSMKFLPVAFSLIATFQSSIMMLGTPAESYAYGIGWAYAEIGSFCGGMTEIFLSLGFLKRLDLSTPYEYFERRFKSRGLRILGNVMSCINNLLYVSMVLYGQGVALQTVTGISIYGSITLTAGTAVIYTAIGGLRAVIWTDVLQFIIMVTGLLAVSIKGTVDAGGAGEVWTRAYQSGRMNVSMDPSPTVRHTLWNLLFGRFLAGFGFLISPATLQRISATKSLKDSRRALVITMPGFSVLIFMALAEGIVAYGYYAYKQCDPLASHQIDSPNQIIPFMIMDLFKHLPGMPGLFLAALSSASLSTVSSALSAISVITLFDLIKPCFPNMSDFRGLFIAKVTVVICGVLACLIAIIVSLAASKTLNQIIYTIGGLGGFQLIALFYLGALFPFVNAKGAAIGFFTGIAVMAWLVIGSTFFYSGDDEPYCQLGSTDQCPAFNVTSLLFNTTTTRPSMLNYSTPTIPAVHSVTTNKSGLDKFYSLSYTIFSSMAFCIVLLVGTVASLATGGWKNRADPELVIHMDDIWMCGLNRKRQKGVDIKDKHDTPLNQTEQSFLTNSPKQSKNSDLYVNAAEAMEETANLA